MPPGMQPRSKTRFEMILGVQKHEMQHCDQSMLVERMIGICAALDATCRRGCRRLKPLPHDLLNATAAAVAELRRCRIPPQPATLAERPGQFPVLAARRRFLRGRKPSGRWPHLL